MTAKVLDRSPLSWYVVPDEIKNLLSLVVANWEDTTEADYYIEQALAKAGDCLDVLVTAYRYFSHQNQNQRALQMVTKVLEKVRHAECLPTDWRFLKPIVATRQEEFPIRLFLNAYSASGLVLARMGEVEKAQTIATQIQEIDRKNEYCASVILDILKPRSQQYEGE